MKNTDYKEKQHRRPKNRWVVKNSPGSNRQQRRLISKQV